mgnify:CR=1 FL=1
MKNISLVLMITVLAVTGCSSQGVYPTSNEGNDLPVFNSSGKPAPSALSWTEQYVRAKLGRSSPMEEARRKAEQENTAFREEATADEAAPSALNWTEQYLKAKFGRDVRIEKTGQRAPGGSGSKK